VIEQLEPRIAHFIAATGAHWKEAHVPKPIDPSELIAVIARVCGRFAGNGDA
jgi:hypothetical protein